MEMGLGTYLPNKQTNKTHSEININNNLNILLLYTVLLFPLTSQVSG